jgi:hypothetical protein
MRWAAVLAVVMAAAMPATAAAAECRIPGHEGPPQLQVMATIAPAVQRHDRSKGELSAGNPALRQGQSEAGLTSAQTGYQVRPQIWYLPLGERTTCVVLQSVEVDWRISMLTIDIASNYPEGSCAYQAIKDHENQHVSLTRGAFERAAAELRLRLADAVRAYDRPVVMAVPAADAARAVAAQLETVVAAVAAAYERDVRQVNASIDTPASYARVQARCRDW